jgi:outer membrane protein assembly factor BamB
MINLKNTIISVSYTLFSVLIATGQEKNKLNIVPSNGLSSNSLAATHSTYGQANTMNPVYHSKPNNGEKQDSSEKSVPKNAQFQYDAPDQVIWHAKTRTWFVSNLGGGISLKKDNYGWITQTDEKGTVIHEFWIGKTEGMHAPSGMTITDDFLYVCDREGLYEIDIAKRKINNFFTIQGAAFINDVVIADNGDLFVSDFYGNKIYKLPKLTRIPEIWLENYELKAPDGLYMDKNNLIVASWGKLSNPDTFETSELGDLLSIDIKTKKIEKLLSKIGNLEGITKAGDFYYITDWFAGKVLKVDSKQKTILDFITGLKNPTDLNYSPELNVLGIPQHGTNQVLFVNLQNN